MGKKRKQAMRFHVPFTASAPPMTSRAVGLVRLVERRGRGNSSEATIIDATDNRLLRSGVVVTHRVSEGLGEWVLEAPGWEPRLPAFRSEPVGQTAELPVEFGQLIRPVSRGAILGPVAGLGIQRTEYALLGEDDEEVAAIRDERVTVTRDGVITARYREATITPCSSFTPQQRAFVLSAMDSVSAIPVERFLSLQQRLGPPATGMTDFPEPQPVRRDATMEDLVTAVFSHNLQDLTDTVLDVAQGRPDDVGVINERFEAISRDVRGLAHVLDPEWREHVQGLLSQAPFRSPAQAVPVALQVSDSLVSAVHAPRLGDASQETAVRLLHRRAEQGIFILTERCRSLRADSADEAWAAALQAAEVLSVSAAVVRVMPSKPLEKALRVLEAVIVHLSGCVAELQPDIMLVDLDVEEAFQAGIEFERGRVAVLRARKRFIEAWPERIRKLRGHLEKAKER